MPVVLSTEMNGNTYMPKATPRLLAMSAPRFAERSDYRRMARRLKLRIIGRCSGEFDRDSRWPLSLVEQSASLPNFRIR